MLFERFTYLDRSARGVLSFADLSLLPEFDANPLSPLIQDYLERTYECMNFASFVDFLSTFSPASPDSKRTEYLFNVLSKGHPRILHTDLKAIERMLNGLPPITEHAESPLQIETNKDITFKDFLNLPQLPAWNKGLLLQLDRHRRPGCQVSLLDMLAPAFIRRRLPARLFSKEPQA